MDKTIKLKFEASAQGLDKIFADISKISKSVNLAEKTQESIKELEVTLPAFMSRVRSAMDNEDFSLIDLKELDKEFQGISKILEKVIAGIRKSNLSSELVKQIEEAEGRLADKRKEYEATRGRIRRREDKISGTRASGLSSTEENRVFKQETGGTVEINDTVVTSYEDFVNILQKARAEGKLTAEQNAQLTQTEQQLATAMATRKQKLVDEITAEQTKQAEQKEAIETEKARIAAMQASMTTSNDLTAEEKQLVDQLIASQTQLGDARTQQANAVDQATKEERELRDQREKNNTTTDQNTQKIHSNTKAHERNTSTVAKAAKQVFTYGSIMSLFRRVYQLAINTVKDMDKALTDMAVVTSMSREDAYKLTNQFRDLAVQTGKTTTEIANMATKFYQQGKSTTQVMQLTEAAAKAATIAGIDGSRSIDLLTNALNGFQLSASQAMEVSDKFAALAASAATNYDELATALSKVAAQANLAGMSMDFTLGLLTKGIETTREAPETIGTALKTVISRMRELTDYGATLEDGTDVNRVDKALQNVGISLMDANGQFRNLDDVLTELGHKWDTLNTNQQANVAVALAGTRQQSRLIAMMQDFDRTLELVDISANSYGATMAQSADYMEGLEAATTRMKTAYEGLISAIADSELIIGVVDLVSQIGNVVAKVLDNGVALTIILAIAALYGAQILNSKLAQYQADQAALRVENEKTIAKNQQIITQNKGRIVDLEAYKVALKDYKTDKQKGIEQLKNLATAKLALATEKSTLATKKRGLGLTAEAALLDQESEALLAEGAALEAKATALEHEALDIDKELHNTDVEINKLKMENNNLTNQNLNLQTQQMGLLGGMFSGLLSIVSILMMIPTILSSISVLMKVINTLRDKEYRKILRNTIAEKIKALFTAAGAAFQAGFPVGLILGAAILAIAGIALAVNAANKANSSEQATDSISKTREELNKLQADLYNLQQAQGNVAKLGDEFDNLASKIIRTSDEVARLNEIAQQINDEAGRTVVNTSASYEEQLNQIRGYEIQLEQEEEKKRQEINKKLGEGLVSARGEDGVVTKENQQRNVEMYMENMKTDPAFVNSIRSVAIGEIEGMNEASAQARDAVLDLLVDNIDKNGIFGEKGLNVDAFESMIGAGYEGNFSKFMTELDSAMTSGNLTDYANMFSKMSDEVKGMVAKSMPMFTAIEAMGVDTAKAFDKIGYSADELNTIWTQMEKNVKALGGTEEDAAAEFAQLAQDLASSDGNKRQEAYQKMVEQTLQASNAAKAVLDMTDEQFAEAVANGDTTAVAYKNALDEQKAKKDAMDSAKSDLEAAQGDSTKDDAEAQKAYDEASAAYAKAEGDVKAFTDAAENANASILQMQALLGTKSVNDIVDNLTKMGSTMERLGKITDLTSLSIKEQMELLSDYPELLGAMERGFLTVGEASKLMKESLDESIQQATQGQSDLDLIYRSGTGDIAKSTEWDEQYKKMFTEDGAEARAALIGETLTEDSDFVQMLKRLNPELTAYEALEAARQVQDSAKQYDQYGLLLDRFETEGYTALMSDADKEAWKNAQSISAANRDMVDSLTEDLQRLEVGTDAYNQAFAKRNDALNQAVIDGKQRLNEIDQEVKEMLTDEEGKSYEDYISYENGIARINAERWDELTQDQKDSLSVVISSLNTYAEEYKEVSDQIIADNEARAQAMIDAEAKVLEAQIENLEKRQEAYEKYFDEVDALEEERDRAASMEDLTKQLAALSGGSGAATNEKRKELLAEMEALKEEEAQARKEAAREALIGSIEEQVEGLNTQLDAVNDSLNAILQALTNGNFKIETDASTGEVKLLKQDGEEWIEHKFAKGGLVDYTGPAWVDGTPNDPEAFLSAADTKNMRALLDAIQVALDGRTAVRSAAELEANNEHITIEQINIHADELNNEQDFRTSGQAFADEFAKAIRQRGINVNVKR